MNNEALQAYLTEQVPDAAFDTSSEWLTVQVSAAAFRPLAEKLFQELQCNFLFCLTCVDWKTHLTMVYHLRSTQEGHHVVVKVNLDMQQPQIHTVCDLWRTAEFHEREVYELFGVDFQHHPDLRLLILPDGWEGKNPLRKDFEDPVNMIKL
jgi:NADH:ubiquinone oxidoreductase subunit C